MAIKNLKQLEIGRVGDLPQKLIIDTDNTVAEVTTAGYLSKYGSYYNVQFNDHQLAEVYTTDGKVGTYQVSVDNNGVASLMADTDGIVVLPVVDNDFAQFDGTSGVIKDGGKSASNNAKTKVMMAGAATAIDHIASFDDVNGTASCATLIASPRVITNFGGIESGSATGLVGRFKAYAPVPSAGSITLQGANNAANYNVALINNSHGQATTHYIPDGGVTNDSFLTTALLTPDLASNLIYVDITVGQAALAAGGSVTLRASSGTIQYKIRNIFVNSGGTNFSGGGGDRLLSITDNTTVYSVIPAASLQTLANTAWGATGLPFPASAAINTSTAAGAALVAKYSGGAADYTSGSVVISLILQRVA